MNRLRLDYLAVPALGVLLLLGMLLFRAGRKTSPIGDEAHRTDVLPPAPTIAKASDTNSSTPGFGDSSAQAGNERRPVKILHSSELPGETRLERVRYVQGLASSSDDHSNLMVELLSDSDESIRTSAAMYFFVRKKADSQILSILTTALRSERDVNARRGLINALSVRAHLDDENIWRPASQALVEQALRETDRDTRIGLLRYHLPRVRTEFKAEALSAFESIIPSLEDDPEMQGIAKIGEKRLLGIPDPSEAGN